MPGRLKVQAANITGGIACVLDEFAVPKTESWARKCMLYAELQKQRGEIAAA